MTLLRTMTLLPSRSRRMWSTVLVISLLGVAVPAMGATARGQKGPEAEGEDVPAAPPAVYGRDEPAVAVHPQNPKLILMAANDSNSGATVGMYRSTDGGATFDESGFAPLRFDGYASDPALGFDSRGTAYLSYINFVWEPRVQSGVFVARSADAGKTWIGPTSVAAGPRSGSDCTFHDKSYLAVDRSKDSRFRDRVYVTWSPIDYQDEDCFEFTDRSILVSSSTDGGRSFSTPKRVVPQGVDFPAMPYPAVDADGHLHITYQGITETPPDCSTYGIEIHVATSTDGGRTFRDRVIATDCGVNKKIENGNVSLGMWRQNSGATIAVDEASGAVVLTWSAHTTGAQVLRVARRVNDGSWKVATIQEVGNLQFPWPAYGARGQLGVVYLHQLPSGIYDAYIVSSDDHGRSWSDPLRLSSRSSDGNGSRTSEYDPFIGDYLGLAVGGDGVAHPVWTDVRTPFPLGVPNIWTRRVRL